MLKLKGPDQVKFQGMIAAWPKIVVIGAGIVGASIAYHLARRGARVTLVDKGHPAVEVTGKAFAWINVSHGIPEPYSQLRHLAIQEYRRIEQELGPALRVDWCGALTWTADLAETERFAREHAAWGYDVRLVGRDEIAALEPNLIEPPDYAAFAASEGAVEPTAATQALVEGARLAGAEIRLATEVAAITAHDRRITGIRTAEGAIAADLVIVAAGTGAGALCGPLGVVLPVEASPAILLRFRTTGRLVNRVISSPDMEVRQTSDCRLLAAEDYIDRSPDNGPDAIAERALAAIRQSVRNGDGVALEDVRTGLRPIPTDDLPIVGFVSKVDGLYAAVMHAGVTMAPIIGRLVTAEILDGAEVKALRPCRLERFAAGSPAIESYPGA
ncbi:MAG: NAD(P)/FAD-dependent oxidoreductase [Kiloniellales bacterium]